ncbi:AGE family epimerase/isomerase [Roseateles sp. BYS180W]|uniref:AGE family epimerase/isomerase n=1 Tax=Roseateles rivi TaxID=3299028 RepID=A0ABW7FSX9_9BURK
MNHPPLPDVRDPAVLLAHVRHTLSFYDPRAVDASGGFFHFFRDDGEVYDRHTRHLVSSTRMVFNAAMAWRHFGQPQHGEQLQHGLRFLRQAHRQSDTGGYWWQLSWRDGRAQSLDATNHCYGLAFVMLAYAHAVMAGQTQAQPWLEETWDLLQARFWQPEHGLYADEASADWSQLDSYRGQNANMHLCEALLAAHEATAQPHYLERAAVLARHMCQRQAALAGGLIWEHYHADWQPDWDYNRHDKTNIFRPWGFQTGHLTEWAKLLLTLERQIQAHAQLDPAVLLQPWAEVHWLAPRAQELFDVAMQRGWDEQHGGLVYGFGPDGSWCDSDKYFWVQAESLATAGLLALRQSDAVEAVRYWSWYDRIWAYSWAHFVDHQHGAWYRIKSREGRAYSDEKSPAGKVDYHTMGACYEVVRALQGAPRGGRLPLPLRADGAVGAAP